jgi:YD repeat-containing protein
VDALTVETQYWHTYDGLGRNVQTKQVAGNGDGGAVLATTNTLYHGDRTTVIPPDGGTATTSLTDARGNTTAIRQHHAPTAESSYDTTGYQYTPRGELEKVSDPAGNSWTYRHDQLGRQVEADDPDKGTTTTVYDDRGQVNSTTDARGIKLVSVYDGIGRQTELRESSPTGALRAEWTYDTVSGAKGHLAASTRYVDGEAYTNKVVAYDRQYRVLRSSVTVPASEGALAGTYLSLTTFNVSGTVQGVGFPKAGALPSSGVVFTYEDETLRPIALSGDQGLKATTSYSLTGKPQQYELSDSGGMKTWATNTYESGTQRLATSRVDRENVPGVDQHNTFGYDAAGNVLSVADVSRSGTDTQCFDYDFARRLTTAWTEGDTACSVQPSGGAVGGPAPYWHSYTYDKAGNRLTETQHDTGGDTAKDTERTYAYPAPGSPRPHSLTSVTSTGPTGTAQDSFTYDGAGNTATRAPGSSAASRDPYEVLVFSKTAGFRHDSIDEGITALMELRAENEFQVTATEDATAFVGRTHDATAHLGTTWQRTDEWYNYRTSPRAGAHVLASLDESSYSGGTMNGDHPIAWCKEYAGAARSSRMPRRTSGAICSAASAGPRAPPDIPCDIRQAPGYAGRTRAGGPSGVRVLPARQGRVERRCRLCHPRSRNSWPMTHRRTHRPHRPQ